MSKINRGPRLLESGLLVHDWQARQRDAVQSIGGLGVGVVLGKSASGETDPSAEGFRKRVARHGDEVNANVSVYREHVEHLPGVLYVLADDPNTHGVLVARPVPDEVLWALEPKQDIDGATPASPYKPALMTGMFRLVDRAAPDLAERQVVVAGAAGKVGSQIMNVLMERGITATPIDSKLGHNDDDLREAVAKAGALFTAMRQPGKLTEEWLPDGIVLFDATVEPVKVDGKTQMWGDVHRSVYDSARDITLNRVPGVIGPLATCALYDNAIEAAHVRLGA